jgi:DNA polymerase-3 subunit epsilon
MSTDFVSIDLETANPNPWSICQIGVAVFGEGALTEQWMTYTDPQERFNPDNVAVHGITAAAVRGWPRLQDVSERLRETLEGRIVVSHSQFDRVALEQAFDRKGIRRLDCSWLDSTLVARRAWEGFAKRGFGLENLCRLLGYRYQRHDALGDAKAAGVVVLAAIEQTGVGLNKWLELVDMPAGEGPRRPMRCLSEMPPGTVDVTPLEVSRPSNQVLSPELTRLLSEQAAADTGDGRPDIST